MAEYGDQGGNRKGRRVAVVALLLAAAGLFLLFRPGADGGSTVADRPEGGTGTSGPSQLAAGDSTSSSTAPSTTTTVQPTRRACAAQPGNDDAGPEVVRATDDGAIWVPLRGGVMLSTDRGASWSWRCVSSAEGAPIGFGLLAAVDAGQTWGLGGSGDDSPAVFSFTTDGGLTWGFGRLPELRLFFTDASFTDPKTGWLGGFLPGIHTPAGAVILETTDGGRTWSRLPFSEKAAVDVRALSFLPDGRGWLGSASELFVTGDGGMTWTSITLPVATAIVKDVALVDPLHGYVLASASGPPYSAVMVTDDGGTTWHTTYFEPILEKLSVRGPGHVIAVGKTSETHERGAVHLTTDGGRTWTTGHAAGLPPLADVSSAGGRAWAASPYRPCLYVSDDGGRTWTGHPFAAGGDCSFS